MLTMIGSLVSPYTRCDVARVPRAHPEPRFRSEERLVADAREFVTIGQEHRCWSTDGWTLGIPRGAFVRIDPPKDVSDELVEDVREIARDEGAAFVQVLPRRKSTTVLAPRAPVEHRRARDVVLEIIAESNVEDPAALRDFCDIIMSKRGM